MAEIFLARARTELGARNGAWPLGPSVLKRRAERVKVRADVYLHSHESLLETHHDVAWFDVPLNQLLLVHRSQAVGDLRRNFECQLYLEPTQAFDKFLEAFPPSTNSTA